MWRLSRLPFRHQLMLVTTVSSTAALLLASLALLYYEADRSRHDEEQHMQSLARVVAANSTAVLAFLDQKGAAETLSSLSLQPQVELAALYLPGESPMASYRRPGAVSLAPPSDPGPDGVRFAAGSVSAVEPVWLRGERIGTVFLKAEGARTTERVADYGVRILAVMAASFALALGIASRLQASVSRPVLRLADGARTVAQTRNYSLRFSEDGPEELRTLTATFNSMLSRIEEQDVALRAARDDLEERVRARVIDLQHEIQGREQAQAALRTSEEKYRSIVETTRDWILAVDRHGRPLYSNPAVERILGYAPQELMGRDVLQLIHPDDRDRVLETFRHSVLEGTGWARLAARVRHRDGTYRDLECASTPILDSDGRVVGIQGSGHDTTERRLLEEQLRQAQKMEAVGRLAGGIAHDFNNLLGVILGYSDLLLRKDSDSPAAAKVEQIRKAGERAAGLTRQLLAFSRKQLLDLRVVDLNAILADTASILRRLIGEDVALEIHPAPELGRVRADLSQMEQVLMNLAVNARDAMPMGGRLTLRTANVDLDAAAVSALPGIAAGRYVTLTVSDTGVGMTGDVMSHLFEPFFTTKEPGKGTGLGLATVYGIVKQSGGCIYADSSEGVGTSFVIYLPQVPAAPEASLAGRPPAEPAAGSETVLLVEDEASLRTLTSEILQASGYQVLEASSGPVALALAHAAELPVDVLLTDVVMPGMSGPELAERLRTIRPGIPVLYMSGYTDDALGRHGVLAPGILLLQKPFTAAKLTGRLREALSHSKG
jgi:PAS domain S-box-containing protein